MTKLKSIPSSVKKLGITAVFCLGVIGLIHADNWYVGNWRKSKQIALSSLAKVYRNRLETTIASRFNAIESVNALFTMHLDTTADEFGHFTQILMQHHPPIRALQYANAETWVTYVYPPKGNEITISNPKHLLSDPKRRPFVKKAIDQHRMTVQGPFELRQGGQGMVVRSPIYIKEKFAGLAIGVIDVPILITEACERIDHDAVVLQISDAQGNIFHKSRQTASGWESQKITVGDTTWTLALGWRKRLNSWPEGRWAIWLFGGGLFLFLFSMLWLTTLQNKRLSRKVEDRTRELREKNLALSKEISEQKRLQEKIRVQEVALRHAQKMDSLGTMAGGVAHEYNNILGIILGNTELALDDLSPQHPARVCLEEIKMASLRGKEVGRQILLFINKLPSRRAPLNICDVIKEALNLAHHTIPKNIEIRFHRLCKDEKIMADASDITQLFINLVTNAAQAVETTNGTIDVTLETIHLDNQAAAVYGKIPPQDYVRLIVSDTGKGIAPQIIERIFEPYFTTKDVDQGLGMGLAVVYGIVKKNNGAVKVESRPDEGTRMEVLFPLLKTVPVKLQDDAKHLLRGKERILLVEDEPSLLKMLTLTLTRLGYQITPFSDSLEALKTFQSAPRQFDLLITDVAMPGLPGDYLARKILQIRADMPIIICTGHSDRLDQTTASQIGISAYAAKPLLKDDLARLIRKVLCKNQTV